MLLCGRGRFPSDEQIALWSEIDKRLPELTRTAVALASALLVGRERDAFEPGELVLREVRIEADNSFAFFFGLPREYEIEMWPMVMFTRWSTGRAEWVV